MVNNPHTGFIFPNAETLPCGRVATRPYNPANPNLQHRSVSIHADSHLDDDCNEFSGEVRCTVLSIVAMHGRAGRRCWHVAATARADEKVVNAVATANVVARAVDAPLPAARGITLGRSNCRFATASGCRMKSWSSTRAACAAVAIRRRYATAFDVENYAVCDEAGHRQLAIQRSGELFERSTRRCRR